MKILEAVYTSASETLNGAQGYGFVRCSRCLPVHIKEAATEFPYSTDAGGQAIYSLKVFGEDESWLLMNCTHPGPDYTRRPSHISHSLAFRLDELMDFLDSSTTKQVKISSVFEFMTKFKWESSWSDNETSRWIEESEDLEASPEMFYSDLDESQFPIGPLLAFDYPEDGSPIKPKRAAWQFENLTPEEMLATFHSAWLCLDPWRGTRKYQDLLAEPQVTLRDSWRYSFTTNMRDCRPDAYQWAVLSAGCPTIPNREKITPSSWEKLSPEEVKEKLGPHFGDLLVERCVQGPEAWAQHGLKEKLKLHRERFEEEVINAREFLRQESEKILQCVKDETEKATETWKKGVNPYCQDFHGEEEVSGWSSSLAAMNAETLQKIRENHDIYQQSAAPLLGLINAQDLVADLACYDLNFNDLQEKFNALVAEYQKLRPYALMSESLQTIQRSETKLLSDKENLEAELASVKESYEAELASEIKKLEEELASMKESYEAEAASERKKLENELASTKECYEAEAASERKRLEDKFRSKREEYTGRLHRARVAVLLLSVIFPLCIVCVYIVLNKKHKTETTQYHKDTQPSDSPSAVNEGKDNKKPENTPQPKETQPSDSPSAVNGGKDNKQPENTPKVDKQ